MPTQPHPADQPPVKQLKDLVPAVSLPPVQEKEEKSMCRLKENHQRASVLDAALCLSFYERATREPLQSAPSGQPASNVKQGYQGFNPKIPLLGFADDNA